MATKILWIEGERNATPSFVPGLRSKGYLVDSAPNGRLALARLPGLNPDLVVLNAASLRSSGQRIYRSLRDQREALPILVICEPSYLSDRVPANQSLVLPFLLRKLLNRIRALVPEQSGTLLTAGPIRFFSDCPCVQIKGREPQPLTPLLAALLSVFLQHQGQVLERDWLFREVWRTDYTGDTRTLDVHIRWLRQKIEQDPRKPQLLKTVRSVGYRLDV